MIDGSETSELRGRVVRGSGGKVLGRVARAYVDELSGQPLWVTVRLGVLGRTECFVPVGSSRLDDEELQVPYSKDTVRDAPMVEPAAHVDIVGEIVLYRYYGLLWGR